MKKILYISLLIFGFMLNAQDEKIKQFDLDHQRVYKLLIAPEDTGVTTVMFPSEVTAIYGAQVSNNKTQKNQMPFILTHSEGTHFFTLKSSKKVGQKGAINVVWNNKVYVIQLEVTKLERSYASVTFQPARQPKPGVALKNEVPPAVLLSLLDKAKAYHLFAKHNKQQLQGTYYKANNLKMPYSNMNIHLLETIRFDDYDTLVFHCILENKTDSTIAYDVNDFAVNVNNVSLKAKVSDASGRLPARSKDRVFFAIQGHKSKTRNNWHPDQKFVVTLPVNEMPIWKKPAAPVVPTVKPAKTDKASKE